MLLSGVVHHNVDLAELAQDLLDGLLAKLLVATSPPMRRHLRPYFSTSVSVSRASF
jgi:hypothetical protein